MSRSHKRNQAASVETFEAMILMSAAAAEIDFSQADVSTDGDDFLISSEAEGRLDGAAGNDILLGASGDNSLDGGSGNDILIPVRGDNVLTGGDGFDRVLYLEGSRADYVVSDLGFGIIEVAGGGRADLLFDVESVIFADGSIPVDELLTDQGSLSSGALTADTGSSNVQAADFFDATDAADRLLALSPGMPVEGLGGGDFLAAVAGDNLLSGGDGQDVFITARGANFVDGGAGEADLAVYSGDRADYEITDLSDGSILVQNDQVSDLLANVEQLSFADGDTSVADLEFDAVQLPVVIAVPVDGETVPEFEIPRIGIPVEGNDGIGDGAGPIPDDSGFGGETSPGSPASPGVEGRDFGDTVILPVLPDNEFIDLELLFPTGTAGPEAQSGFAGDPATSEIEGGFGDAAGPLPDEANFDATASSGFAEGNAGDSAAVTANTNTGSDFGLPTAAAGPEAQSGFGGNSGSAGPNSGTDDGAESGFGGTPIPVEPDGGFGDGAGPIPDDESGFGDNPIPVDADGGIGDGAGPILEDSATTSSPGFGEGQGPIPVEPDGGIGDGAGPIPETGFGDTPIPVEPDGGIGDGAGPIPVSESGFGDTPVSAEADGGIGDGAGPLPGADSSQNTGGQGESFANANSDQSTTASVVNGTDSSEWISGTEQNDYVVAGAGDDEIRDAFGFNVIDGGDGTDTLVVYEGSSSDFNLAKLSNGSVFLIGKGMDGLDLENVLINVERIVFNDREILTADIPVGDISTETNASNIARSSQWFGGTEGDDAIDGSSEDDEFYVPLGDNTINGGDGVDTLVIYEGEVSDYFLGKDTNGRVYVKGPGLNGTVATHWLSDVERIQFNDGVVLTSAITDVVDGTGQLVS